MRKAIFAEQLTAQVKGSANIMVTVVATQELERGDHLLRFKEEAAQDEPRRGNNTVVIGLVAVGSCLTCFFVYSGARLFMCVCVCVAVTT